jgi:hypothetical protein
MTRCVRMWVAWFGGVLPAFARCHAALCVWGGPVLVTPLQATGDIALSTTAGAGTFKAANYLMLRTIDNASGASGPIVVRTGYVSAGQRASNRSWSRPGVG